MVDVHVSTGVSPAQQSQSEAQDDPGGRGDTHSLPVAITTIVSTLATTVCGLPSILSVLLRPTVTTGICLEQQVYHLHAWRLSCSTTKQQDFQERSVGSPQHQEDPPQIKLQRQVATLHYLGHRARI